MLKLALTVTERSDIESKGRASGSPRRNQKKFQNVVNSPLITGDPGQLVLEILSVPELHLLIGGLKL